ncbi:hypothetical protein [Streptomyces sp. NPDC058665]|uniref:hypothetical protein n=1 Tax=Streptomyces sp. NPDC058665 TaxID=3346586 RepID=UPI003653B302
MRRDVQLGIITSTLTKLIPGAVPAHLSVSITERLPSGYPEGAKHTWTGDVDTVAERIFTALYGRPTAPGVTPLAAITEVLRRPVETAATADFITGVDIRQWDPDATGTPKPWAMRADTLARLVHDRLFGAPGTASAESSPLARAEDAKRRRDIGGEIGALRSGERALKTAPWYPSRAGDLVHVHYEGIGDIRAWGETYVVEPEPGFADSLRLRLLHHTAKGDAATMAGVWATNSGDPDPLFDMWFEAGPARITVVRDGRVMHPVPAVPGP